MIKSGKNVKKIRPKMKGFSVLHRFPQNGHLLPEHFNRSGAQVYLNCRWDDGCCDETGAVTGPRGGCCCLNMLYRGKAAFCWQIGFKSIGGVFFLGIIFFYFGNYFFCAFPFAFASCFCFPFCLGCFLLLLLLFRFCCFCFCFCCFCFCLCFRCFCLCCFCHCFCFCLCLLLSLLLLLPLLLLLLLSAHLVFSCFCVACVSFCFYIYFTVVAA